MLPIANISSITGVPGLRPRGIVLRDVEIVSPGGGTKKDTSADVPESEADYPENRMFGNLPLPAFGLYVRHADEVVLESVRFSLAPGSTDARPPVAADDSTVFRR